MNGENGVRRAEDIGGQELSYAEVKAIASGNPAVLTLAEADAELQRVGVLRKNHADEQYLARRNIKELPANIERLEKRLAGLTADMKTVAGNDEIMTEAAIGNALNRIPDQVEQRRQFFIGGYRGLKFGIERYFGGSADVYLEGKAMRTTQLSRDAQGPRAVLNALTRLSDSYPQRIKETETELALARTQLADYEARLGQPFAHAAYEQQLTALRDQLKVALSGTPKDGEPSTAEVAEQIKTLRASHAIEAAPARLRAEKPKVAVVRRTPERVRDDAVEETKPPEDEKPTEGPPPMFQRRLAKPVQRSLF
jgi:hypothetical protein